MNQEEKTSLLAIPFIILIGFGFAFAGSGGEMISLEGEVHPFAIAVAIAFGLQWLAFIPAYLFRSEKYFDLVGSASYLTIALFVFLAQEEQGERSLLLLLCIMVWAIRLGGFLFYRIHKTGKDGRFDSMKTSFLRFGAAWTLQGLWITFTAAAGLAAMSSRKASDIDALAIVGGIIWLLGFLFEAVADFQKARFKSNPQNAGRFITSGFWSLSRHPNYFGEILLWLGVAIIAFPSLAGWQLVTLLSPVFVAVLLCKVSGIPLLEERGDKKWGGQPDYESYKDQTPILIPRLFRKS